MNSVPGKITNIASDTKKTVVKFELSSEVKFAEIVELQKLIGQRVFADFDNEQQELDDLYEDEQKGIQYSIDKVGIANVNPDQVSIDDYIESPSNEENTDLAEEPPGEGEGTHEETEEEQQHFEDSLPDLTEDPEIAPEDLPFPVDEDGPGF
jgi:hypothetical protein